MTSVSKQSLEKTVIHQDLKFSVEFENGESEGDRRLANTTYERNTSKDIELKDFKETNGKGKHVKSETGKRERDKPGNSKRIDEEKDESSTDGVKVTKKARTETRYDVTDGTQGNVTQTTVHGERKDKVHKTSFQSLRGAGREPLPAIRSADSSGGVKQRWEKPGDPGDIPIQARIRGPGPARYFLPTTIGTRETDRTKRQSPSFSFGSRSWAFRNESPGPAYNIDPLLGSRGKENRPSFSFGVKPKTPVRKFVTPGPGSYNTDSPPLWEKRAPQYSISPRTKQRSVDAVPGPNTYLLPTTLGNRVPHQKGAPAITLYGRSDKNGYAEDLANTPGPAKYGASSPSITKRRSPEYSVKGRSYFNGNKNVVPGPGAYSPQHVNSHLEQSPRHVIGVKHSEFVMPTLTPADCD